MNRRSPNSTKNNNKNRIARVKDKLARLRERIKLSTKSFWERRQARLSWWQHAFRTPMAGGRWLFAQAKSLWAAMLAFLGFSGLDMRSTNRRPSKPSRQSLVRRVMHEPLELRAMMAADVSNLDLTAGSDTGLSSIDNITKATSAVFTVDYSGHLGPDFIVVRRTDTNGVLLGAVDLGIGVVPGGSGTAVPITANLSGLTDGNYTIFAGPSTNSGTTSTLNITIDRTVNAPVIAGISDDTGSNPTDRITSDTTPTASGTAEANSSVEVFNGATSLGTATANGSGNWSLPLGTFTHGTELSLTAVATDVAGNISSASSAVTVKIDTQVNAPIITGVSGDTGASLSDGITTDTSPTISGTAEANSTVEVFAGVTSLGTATADSSGIWSLSTTQAEGSYSLTAVATDVAGNISSASSAFSLIVDTTAPVVSAADVVVEVNGSTTFSSIKVGDEVVVTWTEPVSPVDNIHSVTVDFSQLGGPSVRVASETAPDSGVWVASFTVADDDVPAIDDADNYINITATDVAGNITTTTNATGIGPFTVDNRKLLINVADITVENTTSGKNSTDILAIDDEVTISWYPTTANSADGREEDYSDLSIVVEADLSELGIIGPALLTWNGVDRFVFVGTVASASDAPYLINFAVTDNQGNTAYSGDKTVNADLVRPTVTDVVFSSATEDPLDVINESLVGPGKVFLSITFSEDMRTTGADPLVTLSGVGANDTLVYASSTWVGRTFKITYNVIDADFELDSISVTVDSAQDAAGNDQVSYDPPTGTTTSIDTIKPIVIGIDRASSSANPTLAGSVDFTVTFSEPINPGTVLPTDFVLASGSIGSVSGVAPTSDPKVFTVTVLTGAADDGTINLDVENGSVEDVAGNISDTTAPTSDQTYTVATTKLEFDSLTGALTISDIRTATSDTLKLSVVGLDLVIEDTSGAAIAGDGSAFTQVGPGLSKVSIALASVNSITVTGGAETDSVTIDSALSGKNVTLEVETVNLNAPITGGTVSGNATTVNVGASGLVQNGIDVAASVDATVNLAAATYAESVTLNKSLILKGSSSVDPSATKIAPVGATVGITVTSAASASTIKDLHVEGNNAGSVGLSLQAGVDDLTVQNVVSSLHNQGMLVDDSGSTPVTDLVLTGVKFNSNDVGLLVTNDGKVNGLDIVGSEFNNNSSTGFASAVYEYGVLPLPTPTRTDFQLDLTDVQVTNSTFSGNGARGIRLEKISGSNLGTLAGGITVSGNGIGTLPSSSSIGVGLDLDLQYGSYSNIGIRGTVTNSGQPGNLALGQFGYSAHIQAKNGGSLTGLSITDLSITTPTVVVPGTLFGLGLGNIDFSNTSITNLDVSGNAATGLRTYGSNTGTLTLDAASSFASNLANYVVNDGTNVLVDARAATFGGVVAGAVATTNTQVFAIADKVADNVDVTGFGRVLLRTASVFVTPTSFIAGITSPASASVQRAVNAAAAEDTVYVQSGTYDGAVTVGKKLTVKGDGATKPILRATTGAIVDITANDVALENLHVQGPGGVAPATSGIRLSSSVGNTVVNSTTLTDVKVSENREGILIPNGSSAASLILANPSIDINGSGLLVEDSGSLSGLTITGGVFTGNSFGITSESASVSSTGAAGFEKVSITGTDFVNNTEYGLLLQKGRDIALTNVDITSNATGLTANDGISINIRNGSSADGPDSGSENIKLTNVTFTNTGSTASRGLTIAAGLELPTSDASTLSGVVLSGVSIDGYALDLVVAGQVASDLAISNLQLKGTGTGLRFSDVESETTYNLGNTSFDGTLTKYIENFDVDVTVDATSATFGGQATGSLTPAQAFPITAKIDDSVDLYGSYGKVILRGGHVYVNDDNLIQSGINTASTFDTVNIQPKATAYAENLVINKQHLTLLGAGALKTDVTIFAALGTGIDIQSSNVKLQNIQVSGTGAPGNSIVGVDVNGVGLSQIVLSNVGVSLTNTGVRVANGKSVASGLQIDGSDISNNAFGVSIQSSGSVNGLVILNTNFSGNTSSIDSRADGSISTNQNGLQNLTINNVTITGTTSPSGFDKGIYLEKLNGGSISNVTITNVGQTTSSAGIDLNLKYGTYSFGINFSNVTVTNSGLTGVAIKARNDGGGSPQYSTNPASVGFISLNDVDVSGSPTAIAIGNNINLSNLSLSDVDLNGTGTGIDIFGAGTFGGPTGNLSLSDTKFTTNNFTNYVVNRWTQPINATNASFGGVPASALNVSQAFDVVDKIVDAVDATGAGFVKLQFSKVFVTPSSYLNPETAASVQRAANLLTQSDFLYIKAGTYATENVTISVDSATADLEAGATGFSFQLAPTVPNFKLAGAGNVNVTANSLINTITANTGNNIIAAGDGAFDQVVFNGNASDYTWSIVGNVLRVVGHGADASTDDLTGVESLRFAGFQSFDIRPTIASITRNGALETTNADSVEFLVTFTGVTGETMDSSTVGVDDFVSVLGSTIASVVQVGSTNQYIVTVSGIGSFNGPVGLSVASGYTLKGKSNNDFFNLPPTNNETYTLDNTFPAANSIFLNLVGTSDSTGPNGGTSSDDLTKENPVTIEVSFSNPAEVGATDTIELILGSTVVATLPGSALSGGAVTFTNVSLGATNGSADGFKDFTARITDAGSNTSTSSSLIVDYDTTVSAPADITLNLVTASDTFFAPGTDTDNLTKLNSVSIEVSFDVSKSEVGDTIELYRDSVLVATSTIVDSVALSSSKVTFANVKLDPTDAIDGSADGAKVFTAKHLDKAGNSSSSASPANDLTITYDSTISADTGLTIDLLATSDSVGPGGTNADNITKTVPLTIKVSFVASKAKVNDTIELLLGGLPLLPAVSRLLDSNDITNGFVEFELDDTLLGSDGDKEFSAKHTDTADNTVTSATANKLTVDLDTTDPTQEKNLLLSLAITGTKSLKGSLDFTDGVDGSADAKITYKLASLPASGTLKLSGTPLVIGVNDTFTQDDIENDRVTYTASSVAGSASFTFNVLDEAGNETSLASTFAITINGLQYEFKNATATVSESATTGGPVLVVKGDFRGVDPQNRRVFFTIPSVSNNDITLTASYDIPANDYSATAGEIDLLSTTALSIVNDSIVEPTEVFAIQLGSASTSLQLADIGNDGTALTVVNLTITDNDIIDAVDDITNGVIEDTVYFGNVSSNDIGAGSGVLLTYLPLTQPQHGTLALGADGSFKYTPDSNYAGPSDSFTYRVSDASGNSDTATVSLQFTAVNDVPVANDDTAFGVTTGNLAINVLANDFDADSPALTITKVNGADIAVNGTATVAGGTLTLVSSIAGVHSFNFQPTAASAGVTTFTYTLSDGTVTVDTATVTLVILGGGNSAPVVSGSTALTLTGNSVNDAPITGVSDPGDTLKYYLLSSPPKGSATIDEDGTIDYTAGASFDGSDTFKYIVIDSYGASAIGTVSVSAPSGPSPTVTQARVNSTAWVTGYRNAASTGGSVAAPLGYPLVSSGPNLPWINLNQIVLQFSTDVQASLDLSDFVLSGVPGVRADLTSAGVPAIVSVGWNATHNAAILTLDRSMDASTLSLLVKSSGIFDTAGRRLAANLNYTINVLPGDTNQDGNVNGTDQPANPYAIIKDVNGTASLNQADIDAVIARIGSKRS